MHQQMLSNGKLQYKNQIKPRIYNDHNMRLHSDIYSAFIMSLEQVISMPPEYRPKTYNWNIYLWNQKGR